MKYNLRFLPAVEDDAMVAYEWYERKSRGLGEEFLRMFYACSTDLARNPKLFAKAHSKFRRRLLRRFPYAIYYQIIDTNVVIFGVFHCARDPRTIKRKLTGRR